MNTAFQGRNAALGSAVYDAASSGAVQQGGGDTLVGGEDFDAYYFYNYVVRFNTALADPTSGGTGRIKIADGGSVLPRDRVFIRYSNVNGVRGTNADTSMNRFIPGFEKTFFNSLLSFELRAPFATDAITSSSFDGNAITSGSNTVFGNLSLYAKALLHQSDTWAVSGGLGIVLPTAKDIRVNYANGTNLLLIENESVHLQPFLGLAYTPSSRFFAQGFLQPDLAASGNAVSINSDGAGLRSAGVLTDANQLFFDASLGYWVYKARVLRD